ALPGVYLAALSLNKCDQRRPRDLDSATLPVLSKPDAVRRHHHLVLQVANGDSARDWLRQSSGHRQSILGIRSPMSPIGVWILGNPSWRFRWVDAFCIALDPSEPVLHLRRICLGERTQVVLELH